MKRVYFLKAKLLIFARRRLTGFLRRLRSRSCLIFDLNERNIASRAIASLLRSKTALRTFILHNYFSVINVLRITTIPASDRYVHSITV